MTSSAASGKALARKRGRPVGKRELGEAFVREAISILSETPERELSVREVAARLGVSSVSVFHYFSSKETLLAEIATRGFRFLQSEMLASVAQRSHDESAFLAICRSYVKFSTERQVYYRCMFHNLVKHANDHQELRSVSITCFEVLMQHCSLASGQSTGPRTQIKDAICVWSLLHGFVSLFYDQRLVGPMLVHDIKADELTADLMTFLSDWARGRMQAPGSSYT